MTVVRSLLLVALCSLAAVPAVADDSPARPNILWITCEDISPNLGCYGDEYARTPVLDRLALQGVRYTNAYGITGVCAVNRSCLITGMYSSTIGSQDMRSTTRLPERMKCFSETLRTAGYYCTNNSKTDYNFPPPKAAWDNCSGSGHWRGRKPGQPFFSVFNFTVCHESQIRQPDASFVRKTARLTADPHQINNLADDPQYAAVLEKMRRESVAWMKRTGDLGLLPEFEMHRRAATSTSAAIVRVVRRGLLP